MTPEELDELDSLQPGMALPLHTACVRNEQVLLSTADGEDWVVGSTEGGTMEQRRQKAEYLVAAANALPKLLLMLKEARGELAQTIRGRDYARFVAEKKHDALEEYRQEVEGLRAFQAAAQPVIDAARAVLGDPPWSEGYFNHWHGHDLEEAMAAFDRAGTPQEG